MRLTAFLLLSIMLSAFSQAANLKAGPMPGANSLRSAKIWLQADGPADLQLRYWPLGKNNQSRESGIYPLTHQSDFSEVITLEKLEPGHIYQYQVILDGKAVKGDWQFHTQKLWQWREDPPEFTMMLGSCTFINEVEYDRPRPYGGGYEIFDAMTSRKPDMMLWLGDNIYLREADYMSRADLKLRYQHDRAFPELQSFLQSTHHIATWDDHDFGPNNANRSYVLKDETLRLFKQYWANASYGLPEVAGVFGQFTYNDVDIFLLDDRYHRDHDKMPDTPDKQLFGPEQINWLKNALLASKANFKLIASGGQMINDFNNYEGWDEFPAERDAFLNWLAQSRIHGVVFLSGDRHHTEMMMVERPGTYPLYELTCSPLTAGVHAIEDENKKPNLVPGTSVMGERNFCELGFSGPYRKRQMEVRVFNNKGELQWSKTLKRSSLMVPRK